MRRRAICLWGLPLSVFMLGGRAISQDTSHGTGTRTAEPSSVEGTIMRAGSTVPIEGVNVLALKNGSRESALATTTDVRGRFLFSELKAGSYFFRAERTGYVGQRYGQLRRNRQGLAVDVRPGQKLSGIDFQLVPTGVITGRVFGDDNEPRVGAAVQAFVIRYVGGRRTLISAASVNSNDLGEYRMYGLAPDRFYIIASDIDDGPVRGANVDNTKERYVPTYYGNTTNSEQANTVEVNPGDEQHGIDIYMQRSRSFRVRGRVAGVSSSVGSISLRLLPIDQGYLGRENAAHSDGSFEISGVFPGSYVLYGRFVRDGKVHIGWKRFDIRNSDVEGLIISTGPPMEVSGVLKLEGDATMDFARTNLNVSPSPGFFAPSESILTKVTPDGRIVIQGIYGATYQLTVSGIPDDYYVKAIRLDQNMLPGGIFDLNDTGPIIRDLEILISPNGGRVEGMVKDDKDAPIGRAIVDLVPDGEPKYRYLFRETEADALGRFVIKGISPGKYKLFAWDDIERGAAEDPEFLRPYENLGEAITINENSRESRSLRRILVGSSPQ